MTLCAAALCRSETKIKGVEDVVLLIGERQITMSQEIEFKSSHSKIFQLSPEDYRASGASCIVALNSGDTDFHHAIAVATKNQITNSTTTVAEAARLYAQNFVALRNGRAEGLHLSHLGLNLDTFLLRQRTMNPSLALKISTDMRAEALGVETIIAGVDATGTHIYSVGGYANTSDGLPQEMAFETCRDDSAFWSVGVGSKLFDIQLRAANYSADSAWTIALMWMFIAKKHAEIYAGIGQETDILLIDSTGLRGPPITVNAILEEYYQEIQRTNKEKIAIFAGSMFSDPKFDFYPIP